MDEFHGDCITKHSDGSYTIHSLPEGFTGLKLCAMLGDKKGVQHELQQDTDMKALVEKHDPFCTLFAVDQNNSVASTIEEWIKSAKDKKVKCLWTNTLMLHTQRRIIDLTLNKKLTELCTQNYTADASSFLSSVLEAINSLK